MGPGFPIPAWIVVVTALGVMAFIIVNVVKAVLRMKEQADEWRPLLNSAIPGAKWHPEDDVRLNEAALAGAVSKAFTLLAMHGPWGDAVLRRALTGVNIWVKSEEKWTDQSGRLVAGQSYVEYRRVVVGPSFAGLCHELAHTAEFWLDGKSNYGHEGWVARGLQKACDAYES